jgi:hypothetical protein
MRASVAALSAVVPTSPITAMRAGAPGGGAVAVARTAPLAPTA